MDVFIIQVTGDNLKFELKTGKKVSLLKGTMYTDEELHAIIGLEYKSTMLHNNYATKKNKLGDVTEMVISLNELDTVITLKMEDQVAPYLHIM